MSLIIADSMTNINLESEFKLEFKSKKNLGEKHVKIAILAYTILILAITLTGCSGNNNNNQEISINSVNSSNTVEDQSGKTAATDAKIRPDTEVIRIQDGKESQNSSEKEESTETEDNIARDTFEENIITGTNKLETGTNTEQTDKSKKNTGITDITLDEKFEEHNTSDTTENITNNRDSNDTLPAFLDNFDYITDECGEGHIKQVSDKQYYVDNLMQVTGLDNTCTIIDLQAKLSEYGEVTENKQESSQAYLHLNKTYSYPEICALQDKLNEDDSILVLVINLMDTSDWYSDIPMN